MEPRPPRPQQPGGTDPTAPPAPGTGPAGGAPGAGGAPYPGYPSTAPGPRAGAAPDVPAPGYGPGAVTEPGPGEIPLVPRQERQRQRVARAAAVLLLLLIAAAGVGFAFQDRLFSAGDDDGDEAEIAAPAAATNPAAAAIDATAPAAAADAAAASPTATPASLVGNLVATEVPAAPTAEPTAASAAPTSPAAAPTEPAAAAGADTDADADAEIAGETPPLSALLPTAEEVAVIVPGMVQTEDGERSEEEVLNALGGTEDAAQRLEAWGWQENLYRSFAYPAEAEVAPDATNFINISPHRFASDEAAAEALTYFSNIVVVAQGLEEIPVDPIGDNVRALRGAPDGVPLVVLYVQDGPTMYRIAAAAPAAGDPTSDVVALARMLVDG